MEHENQQMLKQVFFLCCVNGWLLTGCNNSASQPGVTEIQEVATSMVDTVYADTKLNSIVPGESPEDMVWIPGGEFSMGNASDQGLCDGGSSSMEDARPVHRVYVDGFFMDQTEVTNKQFSAFVK